MKNIKKIVAILVAISLIWISGCVNKENVGNDDTSETEEIVTDNNTDNISNGQVDITSESEYDAVNNST